MRKFLWLSVLLLAFFAAPHAHAAARFWVGGTGTWDGADTTHWAATSGGAGGQSVPGASDTVTLDANSTGTITVNANFTVSSTVMGTCGCTLDFSANNNSPTMNVFNGSGTGTRTLNMGNGTWTITGSGTAWNWATVTNLTLSGASSTIQFTDATAATKTFSVGTGLTFGDITFSGSGTGGYTFSGNTTLRDLTVSNTGGAGFSVSSVKTARNVLFSGYTGVLTLSNGISFSGNLTFSSMTEAAGGAALTAIGTSGTQSLTSNGVILSSNIGINGVGGTLSLADALSTTGTISLTNGTLKSNGFSVTTSGFSGSNNNVKTLSISSSTVTITGTGTPWSLSGTNTTFNATDSTIVLNDTTTSTAKTFIPNPVGGALTYGTIYFSGTGTYTIGSNTQDFTANTIKIDPGLTVQFFAGITVTVSSMTIVGGYGARTTLQSTTNGTAWNLVKSGGGRVNVYNVSLQDSSSSPATTWYARGASTNVSGNSGWTFNPYYGSLILNRGSVLINGN